MPLDPETRARRDEFREELLATEARYRRQGLSIREAQRAAERELIWEPAAAAKCRQREREARETGTTTVLTDGIPLTEASSSGGTRREIRLITPGWGASGYYHASVLAEFGADFIPQGTHMYLDHPTWQEEQDRPERSVRDLAGVTAEDARWEANHPDGPGLFAEVRIFEHMLPLISELAPHIGVSIRGRARTEEGEAEGRTGPIIQQFIGPAHSVDFVTRAGRGGKVLEVYRQARRHAPDSQEENMPETAAERRAREAGERYARDRDARRDRLAEAGITGSDPEFYIRQGIPREQAYVMAGKPTPDPHETQESEVPDDPNRSDTVAFYTRRGIDPETAKTLAGQVEPDPDNAAPPAGGL